MTETARRHFDQRLFLVTAIAFPVIILLGFGPTYYLKPFADAPPLPSGLVHFHGLLMTSWVVLFAVQVSLISSKRIRLHQRLGSASVALAALIIVTGVPVALRAAKYGSASFPPVIPPLSFLAVPVFDVVMFALLFGGAIYYRKRPAAHKSLMLLTTLNFFPPALARIQVASLQALGPLWFFGFPSLIAIALLVLEGRRYGRLNRVFLGGTMLLVASYVVRLVVMTTAPWLTFATWATSFV